MIHVRMGKGRRLSTSRRTRSITRLSAIVVGLLVVSSFAVAAQAGPAKKQFTSDVQPGIVNGSLVNASGYATLTASVQNLNQSQQLGSAQFTVPSGSGFSIADRATTGAADPAATSGAFVYPCDAQPASSTTPCAEILNGGSAIEFDNLGLLNGQTFSATFSVRVPAACVDRLSWSVLAHQANNFSANPGNFYVGPANTPTTTVVTTCRLNWTVQPADAEPSTTITGDAGTPSSATLIAVKVQNGGGTTIQGANIPISLGLDDIHGTGGQLGGTTATVAAAGVATFSPTIDTVGNYELQATSTGVTCSTGASPTCGTSDVFSIVDNIESCTRRQSCSTLTVGHGSSQSGLTTAPSPPENSGHVIVAFNIWQDLSCGALGYTPVNDSVTFEYIPPTGSNTLTPINGIFSVPHSSTNQVCFASVAPFSNTKKGFTTTPGGQKTITLTFDGVTYTVGVLDSCSKTNPAPCYNKSTGQQIDTFTIVGRDIDDMVGRS